MNDINHIEAVLQAKINEITAMNTAGKPALDHHIRAVEACREWLNVPPLKGKYNGAGKTDNR